MVSDRRPRWRIFPKRIALFEVLARWKQREAGSAMHLKIAVTQESGEEVPELFSIIPSCFFMCEQMSRARNI